MAIRPVLRMGVPLLFEPSEAVQQFNTPELHSLVQDLKDTMAHEAGAGIAAPQIGVSLQVVIFGGFDTPRYKDAVDIPFTVLINPEIEILSESQEAGWEGCLSVPGLRGKVSRYNHILYKGYDVQGNSFQREVRGFHARVVQHEVDHLKGILFPMRVADLHDLGFEEELKARADYLNPC